MNIKKIKKEYFKNVPEEPGIYIFKNLDGKPLYVGKAINLKNRIKSYFLDPKVLSIKTLAMVNQAVSLDFIKVNSEVEALLLEADLIKRLKTKYNVMLRDDKNFVLLRKDKLASGIIKISLTRKRTPYCLGPFPDSKAITQIIKIFRKAYPFADCSISKFNYYKQAKRPCTYGKIGLCPSPCQHFEALKLNNRNSNKIFSIFKSPKLHLIDSLKKEMESFSHKMEFEKASKIRDLISKINFVSKVSSLKEDYIKNPNLIDDQNQKALCELETVLGLKLKTETIEFYDIANILGKYAVGGMIVLKNGTFFKDNYRKFKIKTVNKINDVEMIGEIIKRRFKNTNWIFPELVVIDGGKGQLLKAKRSYLEEINDNKESNVFFVALAKRDEIIYTEDGRVLKLPKDNLALNLLIKGRNEVHRFSNSYYKKLASKALIGNYY